MKKKILVVDDSALMRRVLCDIINSDDRFEVADTAFDGIDGFKKICHNQYDAVVLDIYMPRLTGLELLKEMQKSHVSANVLVASTTTKEGARETLLALEYGALDFIQKPENAADTKDASFQKRFLMLLDVVSRAETKTEKPKAVQPAVSPIKPVIRAPRVSSGSKIIAIASSTGGPKALQEVIPKLPSDLKVPVLLVQHMPRGFTKSLAERLDELSPLPVKEAEDGDVLQAGHVYVAQGGKHMKVAMQGAKACLQLTDEPAREGVKPCANYMYESLAESVYDEIICVVLTGMGGDGTAGIKNLETQKKVCVVAQNEETCAVYGMPKSIVATGLASAIVPISQVADEILKNVGVR
ncbi:MAG TPA: chemotaxis-specific protein-glutamate methyltransferase CheB [Lachnospiraceae bacterium]|jgi:two-component system, chemotaxis family, protein-glutamate methylesterase/glutaminase|nr:chemotaxis-specific protein-glutamate methyltransferase CheB [Lachnospiraceae bacterium]